MTTGIGNKWNEEVHQITDGLVTDTPAELSDKGAAFDISWWDFLNRRLVRALGRLRRLILPGAGNVIVNGTFDTVLTPWATTGAVWSVYSGAALLLIHFFGEGTIREDAVVPANVEHALTYDATTTNGSGGIGYIKIGSTSGGSDLLKEVRLDQVTQPLRVTSPTNMVSITYRWTQQLHIGPPPTFIPIEGPYAFSLDNVVLFATSSVRGMHMWFKKDRTQQMIIHTNDKVYKTSDFFNFQLLASGLTATKRDFVSYAPVNPDDKLLITDGVDVPKESNGTTYAALALPTNVTNARFVFRIKERTILVSVLESGTWERCRFWWAEEGVYNAWAVTNGAGFLDYVEGGGEIVMAVQYNDALVLFKKNRVGVVYWTGDINVPFRIQDFPEVPTTMFPGSCAVTPFGVLYIADDGLRLFNLTSSLPIAEKAYLDLTAIDISQKDAVISAWDKRRKRYLLGVPKVGDTDVTRVWAVHYGQKEETKEARIFKRDQSVSCFGFFTRSTPLTLATLNATLNQVPLALNDPLILGSANPLVSGDYAGVVYEHELTSDDNGQAVVSTIELGPYPKDPETQALLDKRLMEIRIRIDDWPASQLDVYVRATHVTDYTLVKSFILTDDRKSQTLIAPVDLSGEQFFVKLVDQSRYGACKPYSLALYGTHTGAPRRQ